MPFEEQLQGTRSVAVIGAGITGLGVAHALSGSARVTLIEAENRLGGHARTKMLGPRGDQRVDTGFLVFNYANYPNLSRLFAELDVPVVKSKMSFGASLDGGQFEYGLAGARALFAQTRNLANPAFWRMLRDILRFNAKGVALSQNPAMTIRELLGELGTGTYFRERYLLPLSGAIWSTPTAKILDFPAHAMMRFFENHALLGLSGQHQWYTVEGGSVEYVGRLRTALDAAGVDIRLSSPVRGVRRTAAGVQVRIEGDEWELYDQVVMATHSDISLAMLSDPTPLEREVLGAIKYQANKVVTHSDTGLMPRSRRVWSSWNYTEATGKSEEAIDLTYWINSLQPWLTEDPFFVTLNSVRPIREDLIWDECVLHHPVYTLEAIEAQQKVPMLNGLNNTWYAGAWVRNGFHEDGLSSGLDVVAGMRRQFDTLAA